MDPILPISTAFELTRSLPVPPAPSGFMEEYLKPILTQTGFAGALLVLGYYWVGRRITSLEQAMRELIEAKLLSIASHQHISAEVKAEAATMLRKNSLARKKIQPDLES